MKIWLSLILSASLILPVSAQEKDWRVISFYRDWFSVCNMALPDDTTFAKTASSLMSSNGRGVDFVARFWRGKAMQATKEYRSELVSIAANRSVEAGKDEEKKEAAMKDYNEEVSFVLMGFYYDHAAEIKSMMELQLENEKKGIKGMLATPGAKEEADLPKAIKDP